MEWFAWRPVRAFMGYDRVGAWPRYRIAWLERVIRYRGAGGGWRYQLPNSNRFI